MFYEHYVYLLQEMHKNMKTIDELKQEVKATDLPENTKELFYKVLDTAEVASLSEQDRIRYESDWKNYLDTMSCIERAEEKGMEKGMEIGIEKGIEIGEEKGILKVAKSMKAKGLDNETIAQYTNIPIKEIEKL